MQLDNKLIERQCVNPTEVEVINPITLVKELRKVPCGTCYHCRMTKVNEWYTRMYLQTLYSNHCYFVTLTYDVEQMTQKELEETFACVHNFNSKHVEMLSPLTLCKRHHQLFFKHFRKICKTEYSQPFQCQYYLVGEYGSTYGRPHYHMILWTNQPLDYVHINEDKHINHDSILWRAWHKGAVQCIDLKEDFELGQNQKKVFRYVAKYVQKKQDYNNLVTYKLHFKNYLNLKDNETNQDKVIDTFNDYWKKFGDYMCCSKQPAIGVGYFNDYKDELCAGKVRLLGVQEKSLVFPSYFLRKIKDQTQPFRPFSVRSVSPLSAMAANNLEQNLRLLQNNIESHQDVLQGMFNSQYACDQTSKFIKSNIIDDFNFKDILTGYYYIFNGKDYSIFKYDKRSKLYKFIRFCPLANIHVQITNCLYYLRQKILIPFELYRQRSMAEERAYIISHYLNVSSMDEVTEKEYQKACRQYELEKFQMYENYVQIQKDKQTKYLQTKNKF